MGIGRALLASAGGVMADQWREIFCSDAMPAEVLMVRGIRKQSENSANTRENENVISDGSLILVNEGQCAVIVEAGKAVEACSEPGEHEFRSGHSASLLSGGTLRSVLKEIGRRFSFGGEAAVCQRIYYINILECPGNPFGGTVPVRIWDAETGLDLDGTVCFGGMYSYRICDPMKFYQTVSGNLGGIYRRSRLHGLMESELLTALQTALEQQTRGGVRPHALGTAPGKLEAVLREQLQKTWTENRGIALVSLGISSLTLTAADGQKVRELQRDGVLRDPAMAAAALTGGQAAAMTAAAENRSGLLRPGVAAALAAAAGGRRESWVCACGAEMTGRFCTCCGRPRPAEDSRRQSRP